MKGIENSLSALGCFLARESTSIYVYLPTHDIVSETSWAESTWSPPYVLSEIWSYGAHLVQHITHSSRKILRPFEYHPYRVVLYSSEWNSPLNCAPKKYKKYQSTKKKKKKRWNKRPKNLIRLKTNVEIDTKLYGQVGRVHRSKDPTVVFFFHIV